MAPNHYLKQCWNIVNWTLRNKLQNLTKIQIFSFKKMRFKMSSVKCHLFCLGLNVLTGHTCTIIHVLLMACDSHFLFDTSSDVSSQIWLTKKKKKVEESINLYIVSCILFIHDVCIQHMLWNFHYTTIANLERACPMFVHHPCKYGPWYYCIREHMTEHWLCWYKHKVYMHY